jgi:alpha-mannosidase
MHNKHLQPKQQQSSQSQERFSMALTIEWQHRIERWQTALWEGCYRPLGTVALSGFTTLAKLSAEQAAAGSFEPMPEGTPWGAKWAYGWFKGELTLPEAAAGQRIVLYLQPGGESLVWLNGLIAGSTGWAHKEITLANPAQPGQRFEILVEAYAGHGRITVGEGPIPFGVETVPEPGPTQTKVGHSSYGVWREEVYQAAIDFSTLYELRGRIDPLSLRAAQIDEALMETTLLIDPELPEQELLESIRAGRERMQNGAGVPEWPEHADPVCIWPCPYRCRLAVAAAGDRAQDCPHRHQPAGPV